MAGRMVTVIDPETWARANPQGAFHAFLSNMRVYRFVTPAGYVFAAVGHHERRAYEPERAEVLVVAILQHLELRGIDVLDAELEDWSDEASIWR